MNDMNQYFNYIKQTWPLSHKEKILQFLANLEQKKEDRLLQISVFCSFQNYEEDWQKTFSDIYMKFGESHFFIERLSAAERQFIMRRYIEEVNKRGEDFIHAI